MIGYPINTLHVVIIPGGGFLIFGPVGGFILSGRLLRGVKSVEVAWEIETDIWGRFPISIVVCSVLFVMIFYFHVFSSIAPFTHSTRKPCLGGTQEDAP